LKKFVGTDYHEDGRKYERGGEKRVRDQKGGRFVWRREETNITD